MAFKTQLFETKTSRLVNAIISPADASDFPKKTESPKRGKDWTFSWLEYYDIDQESEFYKIAVDNEIQGFIRLKKEKVDGGKILFGHNVELAPHNFGRKPKYDRAAGALIAFGVSRSFTIEDNIFSGYFFFSPINKKVASVYREEYGAVDYMERIMCITPQQGLKLMREYKIKHSSDEY